MDLELALGITCTTLNSLACDRAKGLVAYPASGVLVLFDPNINCQVGHLHIPKNAISCACFSSDGRYITTGEVGNKPAVRVWRLQDATELASFYAHELGISSVLFSPKGDIIVSVGHENSEVNVWVWAKKSRIGTNSVKGVLYSAAFSACGTFFVTAGVRHLKFWYPGLTRRLSETTVVPTLLPLVSRPVVLRDYKDSTFLSVCCGNEDSHNYVYAVTKTGTLVILMASTRHLINVKRLPETKLTCLTVENQLLFLGVDNGDIQIFNALTLDHMVYLPGPMSSGVHHARVTTIVFDPGNKLLTAIYGRTNISIWDIKDQEKIKHTFLATYHQCGITDLVKMKCECGKAWNNETFVTSSCDATVRCTGFLCSDTITNDALRVLNCQTNESNSGKAEPNTVSEDGQITSLCVCFRGSEAPSGHCDIVTGNRGGKICVYDEKTFRLLISVTAHVEEITVLAHHYDSVNRLLVSGSKDHLIHVMDVNNSYHLLQTLDFHTSGITAIKIFDLSGTVFMFSVSCDRFVNMYGAPKVPSSMMFQPVRCLPIVSTPCDITTHEGRREVVVACLDGYVRVLDLVKLQPRRMFKGYTGEDAQVSKMILDPMGVFLVTATTDRSINILNYKSGDVLVRMIGHAKTVTGLAFTFTGDHLLTTAMDGCLFAWRISDKLRATQEELAHSFALDHDYMKDVTHKEELAKVETLKVGNLLPFDSFADTTDSYFTADGGEPIL